MKQYIVLFMIIVVALGCSFSKQYYEGYSNYTLNKSYGTVAEANSLLVQDIYAPIGKGTISSNSSSTIWNDYPITTVGSYDQITNNNKYPDNPDEGTCMPASMCGALYHKKKHESIHTAPLNNDQPRVGFFNTLNCDTIITSLPYRTNSNNILY